MLSVADYPAKIKALAAQAIHTILHDDQGVKAKWNSKALDMLTHITSKLEEQRFNGEGEGEGDLGAGKECDRH